ncbi:hypothetical protein PV325_007124 [Microctonus aethiopoides]|nr:hypothetical protein PV325_007124 [Microctonus aethiopoides]
MNKQNQTNVEAMNVGAGQSLAEKKKRQHENLIDNEVYQMKVAELKKALQERNQPQWRNETASLNYGQEMEDDMIEEMLRVACRRQILPMRTPLTFRDVEDSLPSFSENDHIGIRRWVEDFEVAETYGLEETQKNVWNSGEANIEQTSTIKYIIEGIADDPNNKMMLYTATTIKQLKERLLYQKITKEIEIGDHKIVALIDTGSDLTLIMTDEYVDLGLPPLKYRRIKFERLASKENETLGAFTTTIR